jgi:ATP-dependent Clp protease ATP-binding subunit ClpA
VTAVTEDEGEKLMRLESEMHQRVIGQEEAVTLVANALRRSRAEIRTGKRPIANFLFLGPTGVGKTELTKTIAEVYFGNENQMVRLDMSEYQDTNSIYRLIGTPGQQGTGVLTEAIRQKPFSLVLLDEIEKADPNILNLFLQVMDDGRLTDSVGRVIDFTNSIVIATSNAGTQFVQDQMRAGVGSEQIKTQLIHGELKQYFKPEFLNRFDAIVLFHALTEAQIGSVARLILGGIGKKLEERGIVLQVTDGGIAMLAAAGFDPEFGARPLRRVIQDRVENAIAGLLLQNQVHRKDTIIVDENGVRVQTTD